MDPTPALTASWKGQAYSSCRVLSSKFEERDSVMLNPYPTASGACRKCSICLSAQFKLRVAASEIYLVRWQQNAWL